MKALVESFLDRVYAAQFSPVIPGRSVGPNPESRDPPVRDCAPEVWSFGPSRDDFGGRYTRPPKVTSAAARCECRASAPSSPAGRSSWPRHWRPSPQ
ncbi:hypothetical protein EAV90_38440 [Bradyrhizobium vignae]|nr:hypothetical protein EAV90_38440 [Bradyrhizobium vignae]